MRSLALPISVLLVGLLAVPVSATATPVPVWPSPAFLGRAEAVNLTEWVSSRLNLSKVGNGDWVALNNTFASPDFAAAREVFRLPVEGGFVESSYTANGSLAGVVVSANTSYVAEPFSDRDLSALEAVARNVASNLGLNATLVFGEYVLPGPDVSPEERVWEVGEGATTPLGYPGNFNLMSVSVREWDRRVIRVWLTPWFDISGFPDVSGDRAVEIALQFVRERFEVNATGGLGWIYVSRASEFVYEVDAGWPSVYAESTPDCPRPWFMKVWVEANTGEIVEWSRPELTTGCPDTGGTPRNWIGGVFFPLAVLIAALLAILLFFRISGQQALSHFTRGQIVGYVGANPGANYSQIRESLGLPNGTLAYHLWVLERLGFVRSERQGKLKRIYPAGPTARTPSVILSPLQYGILDFLHSAGPTTQAELARRLGISKQRAHYNLKVLRNLELLESSGDGRIGISAKGTETVLTASGGRQTPSSVEA